MKNKEHDYPTINLPIDVVVDWHCGETTSEVESKKESVFEKCVCHSHYEPRDNQEIIEIHEQSER
jgi:hypothetical protein